jgi:hypothetical protein
MVTRLSRVRSFLGPGAWSVGLILATVFALGGCGGSATGLAPSYLYVNKYGVTMLGLRLVQRDSHLTGNMEALLPIEATHAEEAHFSGATILDSKGNEVPFPPRSDANACGGTSACIEQLKTAVTGTLGNGDRVSIDLGYGNTLFGEQTLIGERKGSNLVFDIGGTGTPNATLQPASDQSIHRARSKVFARLPVVIRATELAVETQTLKELDWHALDVDAETLQYYDGENPSVVDSCTFGQDFSSYIAQMQEDIGVDAYELQKANRELGKYRRLDNSFVAYGKDSGIVSELESEAHTDAERMQGDVEEANDAIVVARQNQPKILGNRALCFVKTYAQHLGEVVLHLAPSLLAAG